MFKYLFLPILLFLYVNGFSQHSYNPLYIEIPSESNEQFQISYNLHFYDINIKDSVFKVNCHQKKSADNFGLFFFINKKYTLLKIDSSFSKNVLTLNGAKDSLRQNVHFFSRNNLFVLFKVGDTYFSHEARIAFYNTREK